MHLYNTLNRRVEAFVPADPARVTLYVCGPTVYNYIHIGNARTFTVFDLLARTLKRRFSNVVYARNITDIDDKINAAAREAGVPIGTITSRFDAAFQEDMRSLGLLAPDVVPYATDHIAQIVAMCERLIASGHAYAAEGHVLFAVAKFPEYGKLSRRDPEEMLAGARIDVAPYKRDPGDFVLWKPSDDTLPGWESPWGRGRPGWHIECSAMAETHLGETIDLHGGGMDLQFPHHENEIAQSECAHAEHGRPKTFARHWMHSGMLNLGGAKMSKSLGNTFHVHDLLKLYPAEALRYALLSGHYRQPLDWSETLIEQSIRTLDGFYGILRDFSDVKFDSGLVSIPKAIEDALDDDLNTVVALRELGNLSKRLGFLKRQRDNASNAKSQSGRLSRLDAEAFFRQVAPDAENPFSVQSWLESGAGMDADAYSLFSAKTNEIAAPIIGEMLGGGLALNILQLKPSDWFTRGISADEDADIHALVDERNAAKKARDFQRADAIRVDLAARGIVLEDTPGGTRWKRS